MTRGPCTLAALDRAEPLAEPARESRGGGIMRTLRLSLVGTVMLALLGGLGVVAVAQEEGTEPTGVVINIVAMSDPGVRPATWTFQASDPRLSGTATVAFTIEDYPGATLEALALRVVNDEGSWVGTGRGIASQSYGDMQTYILSGEGTYEGLSAFLSVDIAREPGVIKGMVIEGELPPFPEPPAE